MTTTNDDFPTSDRELVLAAAETDVRYDGDRHL